MVKLLLRDNLRTLDDFGTDLIFTAGEEKEVSERELKSYSLKASIYNGDLKLTEGSFILQIKNAKISFSAEHSDVAYGIEFCEYFKRELNLQQIFWIKKEDVPQTDLEALGSKIVEPEVDGNTKETAQPATDEPEVEPEVEPEEVIIYNEKEAYALNRSGQTAILKERGISYTKTDKEADLVKKILDSNSSQ